ncbi:MAG: alpha/beta hydrolase [Rhizonema sp. PD37]|nr:alpha/beta hydrolase [Rhizonema sp. PD37]
MSLFLILRVTIDMKVIIFYNERFYACYLKHFVLWLSKVCHFRRYVRRIEQDLRNKIQQLWNTVVTIVVLQGEDDGVTPPQVTDTDALHFTSFYERRIVPSVEHNFPQESPKVFADAVLALT